MDFRRLFDLLHYQLSRYPQKNCLAHKSNHKWARFSTKESLHEQQQLAAGLLNLGLKKGDTCALIAPSGSADWIFLDLAMQQVGIVVVPIHATATANDTIYILKDAQVKYAFVKDRSLHQKIAALQPETPGLKGIYTLQQETDLPWYQSLKVQPDSDHLAQFQTFKAAIHEDDPATIIYTSGTTGQPKG
ncbi:MAG: AMP-binding protein, partial [Phaeodactylibacter sp.]|nr:AMP-binding protein [Phaeodactylibacter sp.]